MSDNTVKAHLEWKGAMRFDSEFQGHRTEIDGDAENGASPMGHLLAALGGCMGIDIADILTKMRTAPESLRLDLEGFRPAEPPRRYERVILRLEITGDVPLKNVERAVELSRERYCSVWKTFDPATRLDVDIRISPTPPA